jgi:hypothetical protein
MNGGFSSEEDLVRAAVSCVRSSSSRAFKIELELDAGVGLADIVMYRRQPKTSRELRRLSAVSPRLAALLAPQTAKEIRSSADLALLLGLTKTAANRVTREFERLGLLRIKSSRIEMVQIHTPPFQTIITVEAKLSDWSRALVQAYRNRQFADESWVVLDHRFYKPAVAKLERFQRSGVGLASVDLNNNLYVHYRAPSAPPINSTKRWHAQAALARRVCLAR